MPDRLATRQAKRISARPGEAFAHAIGLARTADHIIDFTARIELMIEHIA